MRLSLPGATDAKERCSIPDSYNFVVAKAERALEQDPIDLGNHSPPLATLQGSIEVRALWRERVPRLLERIRSWHRQRGCLARLHLEDATSIAATQYLAAQHRQRVESEQRQRVPRLSGDAVI